ncbi:MAG: tetratricopeptide repeat protein [Candidatus Azobacteroides sp.]|nr:tetratricopeptide repeat protein [Candidatus Azobacteroides sp.]
MRRLLHKSISGATLWMFAAALSAQTPDEAKILYDSGKYAEAKSVSDAILKKTPANASANYYYGSACYKLGEYADAEKYLEIAATKKVPESFLSLGDLYFSTYRFNEAVSNYQKYLPFVKKDVQETEKCNDKIKKAKLGANMLQRVEQVSVIDSIIVDKENFLNAYKLSKEAGSLHSFKDFFGGNEYLPTTVFKTERGNRILYADRNDDNGFDLFSQDKLTENFGNKKNLGDIINSKYDENYPYMLNDGVTIYYASTNDDASLGGYDIYITRYNPANDTYLVPENIGMPFNSSFNDYMMAIDEFYNVGWFASDRYQSTGKVIIYVFIPNPEKVILRSSDENYLRNMAKLNSIGATIPDGKDYADLLNNIYNQKQVEKTTGDFEFVITDELIYTKLSDFRSLTARDYFIQARNVEKQVNDLEATLNAKRLEYGLAPVSQREKLSADIPELERQVESMENQPDDLYLKARNEEVKYLMKK